MTRAQYPWRANTRRKSSEGTTISCAESQPRVDERPPVRQVIVGFAAVVVEHDALVVTAGDGHRGKRRQEKGPVRRREHVHHVGRSESRQSRQVRHLIDQRADVPDAAERSQRRGKPWIDRTKRDAIAVATQRLNQAVRLHALPAEYVEARRDNCYTWLHGN